MRHRIYDYDSRTQSQPLIDKRYEHRNQVADLIAWLLIFAIVNILIGIAIAHAEPGDKYEISIRDAASPVAKKPARALNMSPQTQVASGRPSQCPPRAWCGCWLAFHFGLSDRALWNARQWAKVGRPAHQGCVNCIAVLSRGRGGHVGIVRGYDKNGNPEILSGNHNNAVGTAVYPRARVLAYREL